MKIMLSILTFVAVTFCLICCKNTSFSVSSDLEYSFQELVAVEDINRSLILKNVNANNEFHKGDDVRLVVENVSESSIIISDNPAPISIYTVENGEWLQIENGVSFVSLSGNGQSILNGKGTAQRQSNFVLLAQPMLPLDLDNTQNRIVRFLILGQKDLEEGESVVLVASYVDIVISP